MDAATELKFESPSFAKRIRGMLGVDFYRLFHTPMFYIFLAIAAMIPALIVGTGGNVDPVTGEAMGSTYTNAWNIIAADFPIYAVSDMGEYANMNMVFIFGGIMVSIFIGHDYKSGYVKQLFTTHAKKQDYMISKTIVSAFAMMCMCITYLIGGVTAARNNGVPFTSSLTCVAIAVISKMIMSFGWASLYTLLNIIFRRYFGISIASCFFLGTGIPVIAAGMIFGNSHLLNVFLYGSSVYACLGNSVLTVLVCILCSTVWTMLYNLLGTYILSKCDVY